MTSDIEEAPIPATKILRAMRSLEGLLSKSVVDALLEYLATKGINLSDRNRSYLLRDLRKYFSQNFGESATDLLMQKIREDLTKD